MLERIRFHLDENVDIRMLVLLYEVATPEEMKGHVEYL